MTRLVAVAFALLTATLTIHAAESARQADSTTAKPASPSDPATACAFGASQTAQVRSVVDGRGFIIADGREIRIAGIEVPPLPRPGETGPEAAAGLAAKAALAAFVSGQAVVLRDLPAKPDRYGRFLAQVFYHQNGADRAAAETLLAQGHAVVSAGAAEPRCRAALLAVERQARREKLGLWGDPYYELRQAENPAAILALRGRFAIIEGKVVSVRESGATTYVNFGTRWSEDFTVTIPKRKVRLFVASGLEPKRLAGRRVRVRGWIEERGGPWIEATRPEQIEIAEGN